MAINRRSIEDALGSLANAGGECPPPCTGVCTGATNSPRLRAGVLEWGASSWRRLHSRGRFLRARQRSRLQPGEIQVDTHTPAQLPQCSCEECLQLGESTAAAQRWRWSQRVRFLPSDCVCLLDRPGCVQDEGEEQEEAQAALPPLSEGFNVVTSWKSLRPSCRFLERPELSDSAQHCLSAPCRQKQANHRPPRPNAGIT